MPVSGCIVKLSEQRNQAVPPCVVVTSRGKCYHHEGCHHVYQNYNQNDIYKVCSHCKDMFARHG